MQKIRVGIEGGAGVTAGELIRILVNHPHVVLSGVKSESHLGKPICQVHTDLPEELQISFSEIDYQAIDVLFLCTGHGKSYPLINRNVLPENLKIIDLSIDYRDGKDGFIYGLPELNRSKIRDGSRIANPGCFATAVQLALLPMTQSGLITAEIHITAVTGSTGSGQAMTETNHFSWRNNNISVYKPFKHQHLDEICRNLFNKNSSERNINLLTYRGNFTRGIYSVLYTRASSTKEELASLFRRFYASHPFTRISEEQPDLKRAVNTNMCYIHVDKIDDKVFIISLLDNLIKGASGQAVQNMNLMFGLDETIGLRLKSSVY